MNNNSIPMQALKTDQLEGESVDVQVGGGRINFILRARNGLGGLNLNCLNKMRQDKMYRLTTISNPNVFILEFYV
jgi:hypothetical protein